MALSDALKIETAASTRGPRCTVCLLIRTLSGPDAQALADAMSTESVTSAAIARALRREGHAIAESTLRRHRKGECVGNGG